MNLAETSCWQNWVLDAFQTFHPEIDHGYRRKIWRRGDRCAQNANLAVVMFAQVIVMMLADPKTAHEHN